MKRVVANLERLAKATSEYAETVDDPELKWEGRFYATLATRLQNVGSSAGDIIPGITQNESYETYIGGGGYVMSYDPEHGGRGRRVVQQLNLRGELITEFPSTEAASETLGVSQASVSQVASGNKAMVKGHIFRYKRS